MASAASRTAPSTVSTSTTLPKKRKASNASSSANSSEGQKQHNEELTAGARGVAELETFAKRNQSSKVCESRLPSKKRKASHDSSFNAERKQSHDSSSAQASGKSSQDDSLSVNLARKESHDSSSLLVNRKSSADSSVQAERKGSHDFSLQADVTSRKRKGSQDLSVTFEDSYLRVGSGRKGSNADDSTGLLLDSASLLLPRKSSHEDSGGSGSGPSLKLDELMATTLGVNQDGEVHSSGSAPELPKSAALEHLDALGSAKAPHVQAKQKHGSPHRKRTASGQQGVEAGADDDNSSATFASSGHRVLMEAIMMSNAGGSAAAALEPRGRDRLESWGGMSDLSGALGGAQHTATEDPTHTAAVAAAAASAVAAAFGGGGAASGVSDEGRQRASSIPSNVVFLGKERLNSIASLSEASINLSAPLGEGVDVTGDIQAFVAAAMASVGDQIAELAGDVEDVAAAASAVDSTNLYSCKKEADSDISSAASPMIGAVLDSAARDRKTRGCMKTAAGRPRSLSNSSAGKISVDYNAVEAAMDAAEAASSKLGLSAKKKAAPVASAQSTASRRSHARRSLPLKRRGSKDPPSTEAKEKSGKSAKKGKNSDKLAPKASVTRTKHLPPLKKRAKRTSPEYSKTVSNASSIGTPKISNKTLAAAVDVPFAPLVPSSSDAAKPVKSGQVSQKWDGMYEALLHFREERRREETKDRPDNEKASWVWDGNVPTTYKTEDGKALGRWVNNQRSAKNKGTLKEDREQRLVDAGLKWSVLSSSSWDEMLKELGGYIKEQTKQGRQWDGNVPTNYQIKSRAEGQFAGEDKNLGRWVNRQRSLYQAGKLRKDRQLALEKLGLKWSMLVTISWDSMFETLQEYVDARKKELGKWDGNVPANYRTDDGRALGRWINRQRTAFQKKKLRKDYVDKLQSIGLKWSAHGAHGRSVENDGAEGAEFVVEEVPSAPTNQNTTVGLI